MLLRDKAGGGVLFKLPPHGGKRRKRCGSTETRGRIPNCVGIGLRPQEAKGRSALGHWEGDAIVGAKHQGVIATMAERKSRLLAARCAGVKTKSAVGAAVRDGMAAHKARRRTMTFDNGREFAGHGALAAALAARTFFADPHSSCQRGTNEHLNGVLRRFFPKGESLARVTEPELQEAVRLINNRPLKVLGWKTPHEAYRIMG